MKARERKEAIKLRNSGLAINEISRRLKVSKSSVSLWVRNVSLTAKQLDVLQGKKYTKSAIEKRRVTRLTRENARRQVIIDGATEEVLNISIKELFLLAVGLYWAEGSKTRRGTVEFSNSDPRLIQIMVRFFKEICLVPQQKFRGHIHLHPHLNAKKAEKYWSKISSIPTKQFFKTSQQYNRASKGKKDSLPYGTFSIYVCSTELFLRIKGWIEGVSRVLLVK